MYAQHRTLVLTHLSQVVFPVFLYVPGEDVAVPRGEDLYRRKERTLHGAHRHTHTHTHTHTDEHFVGF